MALKKFKPVTPGTRFRSITARDAVTRKGPEKSLTEPLKRSGGRNHHGRITVRRRGGGNKRRYRKVDFKRNKHGVKGRVAEIEYDPNRSALIALVHYEDGEKRYILYVRGMGVGDVISSGPDADIRPGNALPLDRIPLGTTVHNVEMKPGKGGQMARSAGAGVQIVAREGDYVTLRPPLHRGSQNPQAVPRHGRPGRQRGPQPPVAGQGGRQPLAGSASQGEGRSHESGRSSPGRG